MTAGAAHRGQETAAAARGAPQPPAAAHRRPGAFRLYIRPCRPIAGVWQAGVTLLREFHGATVRRSVDGLGLEFIGRCDHARIAGVYGGRLPWVKLHLGEADVANDTDHTRALWQLFSGRFAWNQRPDLELRHVRALIERDGPTPALRKREQELADVMTLAALHLYVRNGASDGDNPSASEPIS